MEKSTLSLNSRCLYSGISFGLAPLRDEGILLYRNTEISYFNINHGGVEQRLWFTQYSHKRKKARRADVTLLLFVCVENIEHYYFNDLFCMFMLTACLSKKTITFHKP